MYVFSSSVFSGLQGTSGSFSLPLKEKNGVQSGFKHKPED